MLGHIALTSAHMARFALGREATPFPSIQDLSETAPDDVEWQRLMIAIQSGMEKNDSLQEVACSLGLSKGISGYMYHTVPVCLYALFRHAGDFETGLEALLNLGGDTDTTGAIYSALAGMNGNVPERWSANIKDFPISMAFLEKHALWLAEASESGEPVIPSPFPWYGVPFRNVFFFFVVLVHCFRRIIPC